METLQQLYHSFETEREEIFDSIIAHLFQSPFGVVVIPDDFWFTKVGRAMSQLKNGFPLILLTAGDVSHLLGVSRQYIHEEMKKSICPFNKWENMKSSNFQMFFYMPETGARTCFSIFL